MKFSFIDFGNKDFIRNDDGDCLIMDFKSWEDADNFIMEGGLDEFGWTNKGTQKFCWDDEQDD